MTFCLSKFYYGTFTYSTTLSPSYNLKTEEDISLNQVQTVLCAKYTSSYRISAIFLGADQHHMGCIQSITYNITYNNIEILNLNHFDEFRMVVSLIQYIISNTRFV